MAPPPTDPHLSGLGPGAGEHAEWKETGRQRMNEKFQEYRDIALKILQPSPADLEHGLALHEDALVVEPYGSAPQTSVDVDVLHAAQEAGAANEEVFDLHRDMIRTGAAVDPVEKEEFMDAWNTAGVTCIVQGAGSLDQDPERHFKSVARFTYLTDSIGDLIVRGVKPNDIIQAKVQGKKCLYMALCNVPLPLKWNSVEGELRYIQTFFHLGVRMMHLTYNRRTMLGEGCAEPTDGGLSDLGRAAIAEMNRVGVIVDVAHSSHKTSLEAAQLSKRPVVASHTACTTLSDHCRCKTDEVLRAIADTNGIIGICCIPGFLGRTGDISAFLDHIDYTVKTVGIEHVAIGPDRWHRSAGKSAGNKKLIHPIEGRWEPLWPSDSTHNLAEWRTSEQLMSMAWTNWPLFTVGLVQRGYSDQDIRKIVGENVLRVLRDALPEYEITKD